MLGLLSAAPSAQPLPRERPALNSNCRPSRAHNARPVRTTVNVAVRRFPEDVGQRPSKLMLPQPACYSPAPRRSKWLVANDVVHAALGERGDGERRID